MDVKVVIDHKAIVAVGVVAVGIISAVKLDVEAIRALSFYAINATKGLAIAEHSNF